jgi:glycerophosphoryl diester phosphodiesterase
MNKPVLVFAFLAASAIFFYSYCEEHSSSSVAEHHHLFFAHRGVPYLAENTDQSFRESLKLGFTALETDVQLTRDGQLIVFHDENAKRLLGMDTLIAETDWKELQKYKFDKGASSEKILSLEAFMDQSYGFKLVYLDIKATPGKQLADQLLELFERKHACESFIVADANLLFLAYLKFKNPHIQTVLEGYKNGKEYVYYLIPAKCRPDYLASFYKDVDDDHIAFLKEHQLLDRKIVYGINHESIPLALQRGLKHFIVDYHADLDSLLHR